MKSEIPKTATTAEAIEFAKTDPAFDAAREAEAKKSSTATTSTN